MSHASARATIDLLKDTFGDRLVSRFGPVNWPPRSCDLTPLDNFLWGYVKKSLVYADKPETLDHLEDNIRRVIADIRPQMLEKSHRKLTSRLSTSEPAVAVLCQKSYLKFCLSVLTKIGINLKGSSTNALLDYFLWGYVKSLVYADKPQTLDHLEDNIRRVIADIRPQMLEKVIENWTTSEPAVAVLCQKSYLKCNATRLSFE
ncbi:hypothetical protein TNCV_4953811 [Trichonephila clavipes]|nr:hypothetical protein TNCV_4953811 [Trichonephila clavipes]